MLHLKTTKKYWNGKHAGRLSLAHKPRKITDRLQGTFSTRVLLFSSELSMYLAGKIMALVGRPSEITCSVTQLRLCGSIPICIVQTAGTFCLSFPVPSLIEASSICSSIRVTASGIGHILEGRKLGIRIGARCIDILACVPLWTNFGILCVLLNGSSTLALPLCGFSFRIRRYDILIQTWFFGTLVFCECGLTDDAFTTSLVGHQGPPRTTRLALSPSLSNSDTLGTLLGCVLELHM